MTKTFLAIGLFVCVLSGILVWIDVIQPYIERYKIPVYALHFSSLIVFIIFLAHGMRKRREKIEAMNVQIDRLREDQVAWIKLLVSSRSEKLFESTNMKKALRFVCLYEPEYATKCTNVFYEMLESSIGSIAKNEAVSYPLKEIESLISKSIGFHPVSGSVDMFYNCLTAIHAKLNKTALPAFKMAALREYKFRCNNTKQPDGLNFLNSLGTIDNSFYQLDLKKYLLERTNVAVV